MAESTAKLGILVQLRDQATDAMRRMANVAEDLGGSLSFAGDKSGILAGGLAAIGGSVILKSINAFSQAQSKMEAAKAIFEKFPDGTKKFQQALEVGNKAQQEFGFESEDVVLALSQFARAAGGDMKKALLALNAAMGLSIERFGGPKGLEQAVQALLPVFSGGGRAVKSLGIDIDEHASTMTSLQAVYDATSSRLEAFPKTLEGQKAILKAYGSDILENLGAPYGFALQKSGELITQNAELGKTIESLSPLLEGLGISLGAVSLVLAAKALPQIANFASSLLGLGVTFTSLSSLLASVLPWAALVLGIGLVIGAGILLVKHWDEVKAALSNIWSAIKERAETIWNGIIGFFEKLPENLGRIFGEFVLVVFKAFEALQNFLTATLPQIVGSIVAWFTDLPGRIVNALQSLPATLKSFFERAIEDIKSLFNGLVSFILGIPDRIANFGKDALGKSVDFINRFIEGFNSTPGMPEFMKLSKLPKAFAEGGIITRPTMGLLGERGAEAVIPLSRFNGGGIGGNITINLTGDFYTDTETAERWANEIARLLKHQIGLAVRA